MMKLNVLAANVAKVGLAGLVLVLLDAPIPKARGETDTPLKGSVLAVRGYVKMSHADAVDEASEDASGVVVWLVPTQTSQDDRPAIEFPHYTITQHNKMFEPHLLV